MSPKRQFSSLVAGLLAVCAASLVGCQSSKQSGSMNHATVKIQGHTVADIQQTAAVVFREAGYASVQSSPEQMVFDRPGTRRDALKWGGWAGSGVTMRVKVGLSSTLDGGQLLEANAYAVQNSEDPFFRTESRNLLLNHRPYQKLLDEIAKRLK